MRSENALYADRVKRDLKVRIRGIPDQVPLRKVDTSYLDRMLSVAGMVVRTSELRPLMTEAAWVCQSGHLTFETQDDLALKKPPKCEICGELRNFELDRKQSRYVDFQILRIQELPEELPPGQLPQFFDVNVEGDIVNTARPGDRVVLSGILRAVPDYSLGQVRTRLFRSQIDCNHVEVKGKEPEQVRITGEDEALIRSIARSSDSYEKLINSVAPVIMGHQIEKEAILLLLAGGSATLLPDGTKLRGDINVLFVGDPGTAKSEMLKFASQVAPRGLYASGRGTSLDYGQPVVIRRAGTIEIAKIGRLIDSYYPPNASGAFVPSPDLECLSYHAKSGKIDWAPVSFVYRHRYEKPLLRLTLQTGRSVVVTDEHSLYTLKNGHLEAVETRELRSGDMIAIPGRLPPNNLPNRKTSIYPAQLLESPYLARLLGYYVAEGYLHEGKEKGKESYRIHFELDRDEKRLIEDISLCCTELFEKDIIVKERKDGHGVTLTISNKKAFFLFRDVIGVAQGAKKKRVPPIVFNMRKELQLEFVRAYIDGDRGVTSSFELASDLQYLLGFSMQKVAKFSKNKPNTGMIQGRLFRGGPSHRLKGPSPYNLEREVNFLGPPLEQCLPPFEQILESQKRGIGLFTSEHKRLTKRVLGRLLAGGRKRRLAVLRTLEGCGQMSTSGLAASLGLERRMVREILVLCMNDGLVTLTKTEGKLLASIAQKGRNAVSGIDEIQSLMNSDLQFVEIKRISRVNTTSPFVYDFSVDGPENFVGGLGGVLCHNTAAGLSAAVIREKNVLMLEAGVVVLADLGIACIDEFDKMKPEDRTALHEMMEQQTVTIAKGGIYAALNARTAILAACNPVLGRYNPFQNLTDNISALPIPLLTRFDLIFVVRDQPAPAEDERLATHILSVHQRKSYTAPPPIEFSLLKKYIAYAKKLSPTLTKEAVQRLKEYYLELRRMGGEEGQIPPTPRTLESLVRIATARARILLRDEVTEEDALAAIALMNRMVEDVLTDASTKKTDFGIQMGKPVGETRNLRTAMEVFKSLEGAEKKPVERKLFKDELLKSKFTDEDAEKMIRTMFREGLIYESKPGYFRRVGA
jgi:replicative DNA helicase Mcm